MNDLSIIRLEPSFEDAKETRPNQDATIGRFDQIVLRIGSAYMQTTNTDLGIAFGGNYQVLVVDSCDVELHNITSNVAIEEFIDANGLNQIHFEIIPNKDFWAKPVHLKFIHTISGLTWYSNRILMTDYDVFYTTRFDYKPLSTDTHFKSIELQCKRQQNDLESSSKEYKTDSGLKRVSRLIPTELEQYLFENIDNFTYRRINLDIFTAQVVYINGYRMTDKFTVNSKPQKGTTNVFQIDFKPAINYSEKYLPVLQVFENLELINKVPFGLNTLAGLGTEIKGFFNKNIILKTGTVTLYKNNILFATFTESDISVSDNHFTIDITGVISEVNSYQLKISQGLFESLTGEVYLGIPNFTDWAFVVADAEYSNTDYNNEYLIG